MTAASWWWSGLACSVPLINDYQILHGLTISHEKVINKKESLLTLVHSEQCFSGGCGESYLSDQSTCSLSRRPSVQFPVAALGFSSSSWLNNVDWMKGGALCQLQIRMGKRIYDALVEFGCMLSSLCCIWSRHELELFNNLFILLKWIVPIVVVVGMSESQKNCL